MTRVQRALATAGAMLLAGGSLATYAWLDDQSSAGRQLATDEERRLFRFGRDHVQRGELENPKVALSFERQAEEGWKLTKPVLWPADSEALVAAIDHLAGLKAEVEIKAEASEEELRAYGLDKPRMRMAVTLEDQRAHEVLIGEQNPLDERSYVTTAERKRIVAIENGSIWAFDRDLYAFRSKRIFELQRDAVAAIQVEKAGQVAYRLERTEAGWQVIAGGRTLTADPLIVDRFVLRLTRDLKAESFPTDAFELEDRSSRASYGLEPPSFVVQVEDRKGGKHRASIGIVAPAAAGAPPDSGTAAQPDGPFAHLDGTRTIAEIDPNFPADLDHGLDTFRDHTIARFEEHRAAKLELQLPTGERAIVERESGAGDEAKWKLTLPQTTTARTWRVRKLVLVFSNLFSDRVEADTGTVAKSREYQLEPPLGRAVFFDEQGQVLADVRIGKRVDGEHLFITAAGLGRIDAIKATKIGAFPEKLEDLVERPSP